MTHAWALLLIAGAFEVGFTTAMKLSSRGLWWADIMFIGCVIASFGFLQAATRSIPLGVAYAVWTGVGAAGTLLVAALFFREPLTSVQISLVAALIIIVVALKLTGSH